MIQKGLATDHTCQLPLKVKRISKKTDDESDRNIIKKKHSGL